MLILDTNVVSELMRPSPSDAVYAWMEAQTSDAMFTTTITQAEILAGIASMSDGRRKMILGQRANTMFSEDFVDRVLVFDSVAAAAYATLVSDRRRAGRPITAFDAAIAAIALSVGAGLATRNVKDFDGLDLDLHNPWDA